METKSLKNQIFQVLIFFIVSIILTIGILSVINIYNSKIDLIKFNQNLVLKQVNNEVNELIKNIKEISYFIEKKYKENQLDNKAISNLLELNESISNILILDKNGTLEKYFTKLNENINIYKGFDYSNKNYYKSLKNKNTYWSNVFLSSIDEVPTISYSFRMTNDKIGVVLINLEKISKFIDRFRNQDNTFMIRVFDRNGTLIINPESSFLVEQRYNAKTSEVFTKLINKNYPFEQATYYSSIDKSEQFGAYLQNENTKWNIVVKENYLKILDSLYSVIISYVLLIILFIVIAIYLAYTISRKIFLSFNSIHDITSKIASGNYDAKYEKVYYKEFNKLIDSFYKMQEEIDKREVSLEKSLESFKSLFNSTMECVVFSTNSTIEDVNDVTLKTFGFNSKDELIGKDVLDFIVPEDRDIVIESFKKNVETPYEIDFYKVDGSILNALVQGNFIEVDGKKIRVSTLIDITDVKNKDKILFQQTKMASMGEMIGNIAHQWRQPLNIISTSASSIKFEQEFGVLKEEQIGESMDTIVQNSLYLSKTIDDFRNFFKMDKTLEGFEVIEIVEKALKLIQSSIKSHDIEIEKKYLDKKVRIDGYPNEFIQVIINLFNNAKDAFISNNIDRRVIRIEEVLIDKTYKLKIMDNAGGIPEDIIYKIFDPYFTTKHKSQGTGIGLYMSHQIIVDHMKGDLYVKNINFIDKNKTSKGSSFTVKLPIQQDSLITYEI